MSRTRGYFTATVLALTLGLTACSGSDAEPEPAPPPSSASSSPSDTPAAPTMPPEARGTDAASAEAFVRFYWDLVNHAQRTGDLAGLSAVASPHCRACEGGLKKLREIFARGGHIRGGENRVSEVRSSLSEDRERATVWLTVSNTRQIVNLPGRSDDEAYPASQVDIVSVVRRQGDGWTLEYWDKDR